MQCNQLIRLMKDWYLHVQSETMAPARMMQFADRHIKHCETCRQDAELAEEIEKIRDFVLPESKIPKSERDEESEATPDISPDDEEIDEDADEEEDFDDEGDDI
ncbi:MAG: hypothetical protein Kow0089_14440 [Desulfobulbaceae bacterium]